jgi:molecular chaperone GrpE
MTGADKDTNPTPADSSPNDAGAGAGPEQANDSSATGLEAVPSSAADEIESLRRERDAMKDQLLRKRAEFDNFRRRTERERQSWMTEGESAVMLELMPVIDHLEQALKSAGDASSLREGVELILRDLLGSLARLGLVKHDPAGGLFDPLRDQALAHEAVAGVKDGIVLETYRGGYLLRDRLLRPALVKVAKAETETEGQGGDPPATAGTGGHGPSAGSQEEVH